MLDPNFQHSSFIFHESNQKNEYIILSSRQKNSKRNASATTTFCFLWEDRVSQPSIPHHNMYIIKHEQNVHQYTNIKKRKSVLTIFSYSLKTQNLKFDIRKLIFEKGKWREKMVERSWECFFCLILIAFAFFFFFNFISCENERVFKVLNERMTFKTDDGWWMMDGWVSEWVGRCAYGGRLLGERKRDKKKKRKGSRAEMKWN